MSAVGAAAPAGVRRAAAPGWSLPRVLASEAVEELRAVLRDPLTLFFSVGMPVGFFALFTSLFGGQGATAAAGAPTAGATMLATYGTFGVTGVALITPGIGLATDRDRGWLRVKAVSATPVPVTLAAKAVATLPHSLGVLLAMTAVGAVLSGTRLEPGTWLRLVGVLLLGSLPFVLLGLAVGALASSSATTAVLQAVFLPSCIASGLWFPLEVLPAWVQALAPVLPTYHLAQLGLAQLDGSPAAGHLLALLASTAVLACAAALALRRVRP